MAKLQRRKTDLSARLPGIERAAFKLSTPARRSAHEAARTLGTLILPLWDSRLGHRKNRLSAPVWTLPRRARLITIAVLRTVSEKENDSDDRNRDQTDQIDYHFLFSSIHAVGGCSCVVGGASLSWLFTCVSEVPVNLASTAPGTAQPGRRTQTASRGSRRRRVPTQTPGRTGHFAPRSS